MKPRPVLGAVVVALATLLCTVLAAQPASAHTPSANKIVYDGGSLCVIGKAQIAVNHATGELTSSAWTNARVRPGSSFVVELSRRGLDARGLRRHVAAVLDLAAG